MAMGFNTTTERNIQSMVLPKKFTSGIVFGRTGSGKTSCSVLPNIEERIKSDYGVLIYDFKGNLHLQAKYLANKHDKLHEVIEIGKPWGKNINLCDYLSSSQIPLVVKSKGVGDYWENSAKSLMENVFTIHKNFNLLKEIVNKYHSGFNIPSIHKNISYASLYSCVANVEAIKSFYENMVSSLEYVKKMPRPKDKFFRKREHIFNDLLNNIGKTLATLKLYEKTKIEDDFGKNGIVNHLSTILNQIATKAYLNESDLDIIKELRAGKIIIIDVSNLSESVLNAINTAIYTRLQKASYFEMKPVCIVIDEAQKVLNSEYLPQVDVCRESNFEYLFATQDEILLKNKLGENQYQELYTNIISRYSFNTNDNEQLKEFEYINLANNRSYFAKPIFIDKKELIKVEYKYLQINNLLRVADYESPQAYMFVTDNKLLEEYKIVIETIDEQRIVVDYLSMPKEIPTRKSFIHNRRPNNNVFRNIS
ncbi:MAG: TraM recognition domain-containing protein [Arcobacteraceae bacterium]